jgi:hypothetical protein
MSDETRETRESFLKAAAERCLAAIKAAKAGGRHDRMAIKRATAEYHRALVEADKYPAAEEWILRAG